MSRSRPTTPDSAHSQGREGRFIRRAARLLAGALVASLVPLGATLNAAADGGNSISTATPYTLGTTVNDSITESDKTDFFRFTLTDAGKVDLTLNASISRLYLKWYDANGKQLFSDLRSWNDTTKKLSHTEQKYLNAGTYYIAIEKYGNGTGTYDLSVTATSSGESFKEAQTGSDNSIDQANQISLDTTYKGQISSVYDNVDFFQFTIADAGKVDLSLNAGVGALYLRWYDTAGKQLEAHYRYADGTTKKIVHTEQKYLNAGTYYIAIEKYGNGTGTYDLSVTATSSGESFKEAQTGSDNSIDQANQISLGTTYKGQISSVYDNVDFFQFTIADAGKVDLSLNAGVGALYLRWYDTAGKQLEAHYRYADGTTKKIVHTEQKYLNAGTYYIAIEKYGNGTGTYDLRIATSFASTPAPTISGTAKVGKTLTASPGSWKPSGATFGYQWLRDGKAIKGATKSTYKLGSADAGRSISVKVTGKKAGYSSVSKTSSAKKIPLLNLSQTPTPKISGTAKVGKTLTAKPGTWSPSGVKLSYQWMRNGTAIKGVTTSTYKVSRSDAGKKIAVKVTGKKSGYKTVSKTSSAKKAKK
ncbi:hypothetical protein [Tessaracoccus caeni]|uniref:hypothetical protein n=1 Tax=Tessaracoccus caeni TaxID=3031239 RepID=UPI0023DC0BD1|nr:hypothetical protein [Tessaracoccus caeni]MDF1487708.1 hypothetical protein [Tessaracoccus caeni]